jgi:hypothetical protein
VISPADAAAATAPRDSASPARARTTAKIARKRRGVRLQCARGAGAARLGAPRRSHDLAAGRPSPGEPAPATDRLLVRQRRQRGRKRAVAPLAAYLVDGMWELSHEVLASPSHPNRRPAGGGRGARRGGRVGLSHLDDPRDDSAAERSRGPGLRSYATGVVSTRDLETTGLDDQQLYGGTQPAFSITLLLWKRSTAPRMAMARKPAGRRTGTGASPFEPARRARSQLGGDVSPAVASEPHSVLGPGSGARMSRRLCKTGPQHWLERRSSDAAKEIPGAPAGLA